MILKLNDAAKMAQVRSDIYGLLAEVYRSELTVDIIKQAKTPGFIKVMCDLGVRFGEDFSGKSEEELVEDLAVEYARLFIGPGKHISPHESVHHERDDGQWGSFWGKSTVEVKKFIEAAGLEYNPNYRDMPDHISVELEFMQNLTLNEKEAWARGDRKSALHCLKIQKRFMDDHISRWVPKFCDLVSSEAQLTFYSAMARLTKKFIEIEEENIVDYMAED